MTKFNLTAIFAFILAHFLSAQPVHQNSAVSQIMGVEAAPVNDAICDAIAINCGDELSGTTVEATPSSLGNPSCSDGTDNDVFYTFMATEGNTYTITINGDNYDGVLAIYSGFSCTSTLTEIACADDGIGTGISETITFTPTASTPIYIQTYDWNSNGGDFTISLTCEFVNDLPCDALELSCGQSVDGSTAGATESSVGIPSCGSGTQADVFYKIEAIAGNTYTVTVNGGNYDGILAAYTGSCAGTLTELACSDEGIGDNLIETIEFSVPDDGTVYIQTFDWGSTGGAFTITLACEFVNDIPCDALELSCGQTASGSTVGATESSVGIPSCGSGTQADVFYKIEAIAGNTYTVTVNGENYDGILAAYTGSCAGTLTELACSDEGIGDNLIETIEFSVPENNTVYIQTYDWSSAGGEFTIALACEFVNDAMCDALELTCGQTASGSTTGATASPVGVPTCGSGTLADVFYKIEAVAGLDYTVTVNGENFDGILAAYTGNCEGELTELDCSDEGIGDNLIETIEFSVSENNTVYIQTYDWSSSGGEFEIIVSCANAPYDEPCDARELVCGESYTGNSAGASQSALGNPTCATGSQEDLFFKFSALANVEYTVTVNGDDYDAILAAYTGSCSGELTELDCSDVGFNVGIAETVNITVPTDQVITLQAYDFSNGTSADFTITLECLTDPTGLDDINQFNFEMYPNPTKDRLFVDAPLTIETATLTNVIGQEVKAYAFTPSQNIEINVSDLDAGVYILQLSSSENKISTAKVVVE